jgi:hypothetical protein
MTKPCDLHVPTVSKSGSLNLLEPSGPVTGLYRDFFTFTYVNHCDLNPKRHCVLIFFLVCQPDNDHTRLKHVADFNEINADFESKIWLYLTECRI